MAGFKCKLRSWNTKSCWVTNSQFNWKLLEYSRDVSVHIWIVYAVVKQPGSSKADKKGGAQKKKGKRVHWVIYEVFGNTLLLTVVRLRVQVEIHIRGLSVWSMSRGITTAGEVSWQTGPGQWMVLRTSLHSYINRIKTSNWGLSTFFSAFRKENQKDFDKTWTSFKRQKDGGRTETGGFKGNSVSHDLEFESSSPSISAKHREAQQSFMRSINVILGYKQSYGLHQTLMQRLLVIP